MILRPYKDADAIREMVKRQEDMKVPTELLPTCPHCGKPMTMNLRFDDTFVEDEGWHRAAARYESFLRTRAGQKILFLELGVGYNTPAIIKCPFWQMTANSPNATYVCINQGQAVCPQEIERQPICIDMDIVDAPAARRSESRCCIAGLAYSGRKAKMPRSSRCWSSDCGDSSLAAFCSRRSSPSRTAARPPTADQLRHPPAHRHRFYSPRCAACSVLFAFQSVPAQNPQHQNIR